VSLDCGIQGLAQGRVNFSNRIYDESEAKVYDVCIGQVLRGTNFLAQLYVGPLGSREEDLKAVDYPPVSFQAGALAGYFFGGTRVIADSPPGTKVLAQVRVWTAV
jgi:hypothetical protein